MPETIGFIGLGLMGRPMATNLIKAGHSLVVHSRSPQPVDALVALGAKRAETPADVARQVTRLVTMVPDSPDVEQVLEGPNGLASVEALFLAHYLLGRPVEGLLDHYRWAAEFLQFNGLPVESLLRAAEPDDGT